MQIQTRLLNLTYLPFLKSWRLSSNKEFAGVLKQIDGSFWCLEELILRITSCLINRISP